jgi:hypothetical protein
MRWRGFSGWLDNVFGKLRDVVDSQSPEDVRQLLTEQVDSKRKTVMEYVGFWGRRTFAIVAGIAVLFLVLSAVRGAVRELRS